MPMMNPNILLGLMQGVQSGTPPTQVEGMSDWMVPKLTNYFQGMDPTRLGTMTDRLATFAPTWQEGDRWRLREAFGGGMGMHGGFRHGGFMGGGFGGQHGMGGQGPSPTPGTPPTPGASPTPGMGPGMGGGPGMHGLRGRGGK
jgi:hypothetical protein